jgi:hypothetical protein
MIIGNWKTIITARKYKRVGKKLDLMGCGVWKLIFKE